MAPQFWALRCCRCRLFQVQQAKRSGKWSCSVCGQRQAVQKLYGQGSALDCRRHVQKLNLLQGEAEEAIGWTSRCVEDSVNDRKNTAAQHEDSSVQQEGRAEVSRWSKYLDKNNEDQEDGEEEAGTERQQFCSRRKNTVEEQRKHQKSFLSSDAQEYAKENEVSQLAYQAKKHKKCSVAVPYQDDGDAVCGHSMAPAVCEPIVPEKNTPTPSACTKPSKWEKFLSRSNSYSENTARITLSPQEGSGRLGLHSMAAADAGMVSRCSEQAQRTLSQGTGFEFKKCVASTEQIGSKLPGTMVPSISCAAGEDVLFKEPQSQLVRAGSGIIDTAGRCCSESTRRANNFVNCSNGPKPSIISCEHLFCTGDEFDDDL
ncbi:MRN complex-interacting protein isoform X1 [Neopsephotus bourkii]|uniref:MRN complex-interacting protein isoform X1 n=1 Tax=Neopsephotus bourkii TaxID=309878 RepID=UPI002AA52B91|nr:MRN complex-interacting protein isoform X1 [Neopsephotus bourkii]